MYTRVRAARTIFQVHSSRLIALKESEIKAILGRHPVPLGHVEVTHVSGNQWRKAPPPGFVHPQPRDFQPVLSIEDYARLRRALTIYRIECVEVDPDDLGYLRAALLIAGEIAALTDALVVDVTAWQTRTAERIADRLDSSYSVLDHVSIHVDAENESCYWVHTHGMCKFQHPDFEVHGVPQAATDVAVQLLHHLASAVVSGGRFQPGEHTRLCGFTFSFERCLEPQGHFTEDALRLHEFELVEDTDCSERRALAASRS